MTNRGHEHGFDVKKQDEWLRSLAGISESIPIAVAVCDIDNFLGINTAHGHDVGDVVLRVWERTLAGSVPGDALVGRIGGDEYAVALPETSTESALIVMEEIRAHFAAHPPTPKVGPVSVSIGIAARPPHAKTPDELLAAAKEGLMRAKREGRNRIAIYVEEKMTLKSNYYTRGGLDRLARLSATTSRTEASLLREALDDLLAKYQDET
jgi:diguanylate cyclase (GGDEF)-like protein